MSNPDSGNFPLCYELIFILSRFFQITPEHPIMRLGSCSKVDISRLPILNFPVSSSCWINPRTDDGIHEQFHTVIDVESGSQLVAPELDSCEYVSLIDSASINSKKAVLCKGCREPIAFATICLSFPAILTEKSVPIKHFCHPVHSCIERTLQSPRQDSIIVESLRSFNVSVDRIFTEVPVWAHHKLAMLSLVREQQMKICIKHTPSTLFRTSRPLQPNEKKGRGRPSNREKRNSFKQRASSSSQASSPSVSLSEITSQSSPLLHSSTTSSTCPNVDEISQSDSEQVDDNHYESVSSDEDDEIPSNPDDSYVDDEN